MGHFIKHEACTNPECSSTDGMAIYEDLTTHCFVCKHNTWPDGYKKDNSLQKSEVTRKVKLKDAVTQEQTDLLKSETSNTSYNYRGITTATTKALGVRTEVGEDSGEVTAVYYPCTEAGELVGWKCRTHPKEFGVGNIGRTGNTCDMFGQFKFKDGGKTCLIVGGEHDTLAAYQMLKDYYKAKSWEFEPVVVSPTVGETGCAKQVAAQYTFFDKFEKIVIGMDNDDAGEKAVEKIVAALPKGKVFIAKWSLKDPNEMLLAGKAKQFLSNFYDAKAHTPAGLVGSSELHQKIIDRANRAKIPLPQFLHKLETMIGNFELQTCGLIAAGTGAAKTTLANEIIYNLIFNSPYKTGIVSLELDAGMYGQVLLSRHIGNKIANISNVKERVAFIESEAVKKASDDLFKNEDGSNRFVLLDEREFSIKVMQDKILEMIISSGAQVIVLDPVSDLFEGLPYEEQASFMKFIKSTMKNYPVSFLLLAHIRKSTDNNQSASKGASVPEEAIFGSSSMIKSANWVVLLSRDKHAEDDVVRNTTHVVVSKNRATGVTGKAGSLYYDNTVHKLFDLDDWLEQQ